jgi:hypothetical protein
MSQIFLFNATFHLLLNTIDQELANTVVKQGCPHCKGKLHRADYPRSPLGVLAEFRNYYDNRLGFCCADCRKRTTPTSVRFFGRRWYPAPFFILISALTLGVNQRRLMQVKQHVGLVVGESTWRRWRRWWRDLFTKTRFWEQAKGQLPPIPAMIRGPYPRVLLDTFQGKLEKKVALLLRLLSPLTGGNLRAT